MNPQELAFSFDATQFDPFVVGGARPVYEAGVYLMAITDMVRQSTSKNPTGLEMLKMDYTIYSDPYNGQKFTDFVNLFHANEQAQQFACNYYSSVMHAVAPHRGGSLQVQNLSEVANLPMWVELSYEEGTAGGMNMATGQEVKAQPARNRVVRHMPYDPNQPAPQPSHPVGGPPQHGGAAQGLQPSQNAAAAASAPPMGQQTPPPFGGAQQTQQTQTPPPFGGQRTVAAQQTPPPFGGRPGNGQAGAAQMAPATQQTIAAQPGGAGAAPPWTQHTR